MADNIEHQDKGELVANCDRFNSLKHSTVRSSTTEQDFDYLYKNNYLYTIALWKYCAQHGISFIYASSAATYGAGELGFDDKMDIKKLMPLNRYGYSKHIFDLWAEKQDFQGNRRSDGTVFPKPQPHDR